MTTKNLHNIQIEGRLTKDPVARQTRNEKVSCEFTLAYNTIWKTDTEGSTANFLQVISYENLAKEFMEKAKKGMKIIVAGELTQKRWKDKENKTRESFRLMARDFMISDLKNRPQMQSAIDQSGIPQAALIKSAS